MREKIDATEIRIWKSGGSQGLNSGHLARWLSHLACPQITFCGLPSFAREHCITSSLALAGKVEAKVKLRDYLQGLNYPGFCFYLLIWPWFCYPGVTVLSKHNCWQEGSLRNRPPSGLHPLSLPVQHFLPTTRLPESNLIPFLSCSNKTLPEDSA